MHSFKLFRISITITFIQYEHCLNMVSCATSHIQICIEIDKLDFQFISTVQEILPISYPFHLCMTYKYASHPVY